MIVVGLALAYLGIGVLASVIGPASLRLADRVALALVWPIYAPILLERPPPVRPAPTLRVDDARRALAAALAEDDRRRKVDALRQQIGALEAELHTLEPVAAEAGNDPSDPDVGR